jgi:hypothetical protein
MSKNFATYGGIVAFKQGSSGSIINNTITTNYTTGGAISCDGGPSPTIENNIISHTRGGAGIYLDAYDPQSKYIVQYNDFWDNDTGNFLGFPASYGDTTWGINLNGTPCDSFHNIIRDPVFEDTSTFNLDCNSPCIDAGDSSFVVPPGGGERIDIGAVEFTSLFTYADPTDDGWITLTDVIYMANYLLKSGPSPIPVWCSGDVNCDNQINLVDVIHLANFLLKGGPPPCK